MFTKKQNNRLKNRLFVGLLIVVFAAIFLAQDWLAQNIVEGDSCDITKKACSIIIDQKSFTVSFESPPQIEEQSRLHIDNLDGANIKDVSIRGLNMFMGKIPVVEEHADQDTWTGWTFLGACSEPNMIWELTVAIEGSEESGRLIFQTSVE